MPLLENPDLMRLFDEFMEIGLSLDMFRKDRKFEGGSNGDRRPAERASHPDERQKWLMTHTGPQAEATNLACRRGVAVPTMMIPWKNESFS